MPHRRSTRKGSFGNHLDEVVKHFPDDQDEQRHGERDKPAKEKDSIHDRLFEKS